MKIRRLILFIVIFYLSDQLLFSQHTSRNNYAGTWEAPSSWNPQWPTPQTTISGFNVNIYGYITRNGPLTFEGNATDLIVSDTLVITGDLTIGNNGSLTITDTGILIVTGNLNIHNDVNIIANGYLIVTKNIIKIGGNSRRTFISNDNPVKLFIGGSVDPALANNNDCPVLECSSPPTIPYPVSKCSYGNMADLKNDPIFPFFQSICPSGKANSNSPVCEGDVIHLSSAPGTDYTWNGPAGFTSIFQEPTIVLANIAMAGTYTVAVTSATGCISVASTDVSVNALPVVTITSSSNPICIYDTRILTANPQGGSFTVTSGPGNITGNILQPSDSGEIGLSYSFTDICTNLAVQSILVIDKPDAVAGHDQELQFVFETKMDTELSYSETGVWSLLSGSGKIADVYSPVTGVTDLSIGKNVFLWTVQNSLCEASAEVTLTVFDLFIPSVITPNEDGKNDKFKLSALRGRVELIIFNRWGNVEYDNSNYLNDWEGQNDKGAPLPNDTYLYVIRFENGITRNGTVLITR